MGSSTWKAQLDMERAKAQRLQHEVDRLNGIIASYEHRITWDTTCENCANVLDKAIAETNRAEKAESEVYRLKELIRGENVSAAKLADANNAKDVAEDELERQTAVLRDQLRWREEDLLTFEMTIEDLSKADDNATVAGIKSRCAQVLAEVEARHSND